MLDPHGSQIRELSRNLHLSGQISAQNAFSAMETVKELPLGFNMSEE